jgi:hypothetical protein
MNTQPNLSAPKKKRQQKTRVASHNTVDFIAACVTPDNKFFQLEKRDERSGFIVNEIRADGSKVAFYDHDIVLTRNIGESEITNAKASDAFKTWARKQGFQIFGEDYR